MYGTARADSSRPQSIQNVYTQTDQKSGKEIGILYTLLFPDNMQAGTKYPLILLLHGRNGTSPAAKLLATPWMRKNFSSFVLMPQITDPEIWAMPGYTDPTLAMHSHVMQILKSVVETYPVDTSRLYLTGHSMGGVGAYGFLSYYPDTFAAAAVLCGIWTEEDAKKIVKTPLWIFQGDLDQAYPVKDVRLLIGKLKDKNKSVQYTEYKNTGHDLKKAYYSEDVWAWMFAQKRILK